MNQKAYSFQGAEKKKRGGQIKKRQKEKETVPAVEPEGVLVEEKRREHERRRVQQRLQVNHAK